MLKDEPCVQATDDTDLYKLSTQHAYLVHCPRIEAVFQFFDRNPHGLYNNKFLDALKEQIKYIGTLRTEPESIDFLSQKAPWLGREYLEYFRNFRPNPDLVNLWIENGGLRVFVLGPIEEASMWEIYLMETISELNFRLLQTNWNYARQYEKIRAKVSILAFVSYSDFGSRRRRDFETHDLVVSNLVGQPGFIGTSNVYLARKYGIKALGTYPHEWVQAISALESLQYANRYSMQIWQSIFKSRLGTALPDTFGTKSFFRDFDHTLAREFDSVRHDSGDPIEFAEKLIKHYEKVGINPLTKTIIFSDSLNPQKCLDIANNLKDKIKVSFGIGTNFTNDFENSPALNMVIKLVRCNGTNVVKLSDSSTKAIGDKDAIRVARYVHNNTPLD
jgi:nicotinate phosphoribosyltransferase